MPDLGIEVLFKGKNMLRLLGGLWTALRISLIAVVISIPLGILLGVLMTKKNRMLHAILRVYLEFIRIMPQMVLLFLVYKLNDTLLRLGSLRRGGVYHRIRPVGNCRDE